MSNIRARTELLKSIEAARVSKAILYVTGDRNGLETKIGQDVIDLFVDHLDDIGPVRRISLILYTSGGNTSAAWNIVNLIRMYCDEFEVIAPGKCMSAGTLISLGADTIVMTKQATLGPIDPTIQHPLGPSIPGASADARAGVSVEAVNGYLDAIRACQGEDGLEGRALLDLAGQVHPLVLGQIFRSRQQIRDLAERLLQRQEIDASKVKEIVEFLCSESGSHDYTINRREALALGLSVEKCSTDLYTVLRQLTRSLSDEMELRNPFQPNFYATQPGVVDYSFTRAVIESSAHGGHHFVSEGCIEATEFATPEHPSLKQQAVQDRRAFEGWRKVDVP